MWINLNDQDWRLRGWLKNQWRIGAKMETGVVSVPVVGPISARVPGSVQTDLLRAGLLEDWNHGVNSLKCEWAEHREWSYECGFDLPPEARDQKIILHLDGLDYSGQIFVNNDTVFEFRGMHRRFEADITASCMFDGVNKLTVIFEQPPEVDGTFGYTSRGGELKSRFNYTWDWCPRLVNIGIWRGISIQAWSRARITDFYPRASAGEEGRYIDAQLTMDAAEPGEYEIVYTVASGEGRISRETQTVALGHGSGKTAGLRLQADWAQLWWPSGMGDQPLYEISAALYQNGVKLDERVKTVGFREIRFVRNDTAPEQAQRYTAVVNGRKLFLRGFNWVPVSPFYGDVRFQDYEKYLRRMRDMNANLLRVWGGAVLESEDFYQLCDRYGILVWQEFSQSSSCIDNAPCEEREYLDRLAEAAREYILQRRHHACHAVWCGGNELLHYNAVPADLRSGNLHMLSEMVRILDPGKHFLPASPSGNHFNFCESEVGKGFNHDVHGPWDYLGETEHYRINNINDSLLTSETGCTAMPRLETLREYSAGMPLWPPDESNYYYMHRGAWWIRLEQMTRLFGAFKEDGSQLAEYVKASRYLQAESLAYSAQAARRRWPQRSGMIIWMGNEPFPNSSNTSVIEYDGTPKPAYYKMKSAFAPVAVSAKYEKIAWRSGECFETEIFLSDDDFSAAADLTAQIFDARGGLLFETAFEGAKAEPYTPVGKISYLLGEAPGGVFLLRLNGTQDGGRLCREEYVFTLDGAHTFGPLRSLPKTALAAEDSPDGGWIVRNTGAAAAVGVFAYAEKGAQTAPVDEGFFCLLPGEEKRLCSDLSGAALRLSAMNTDE